MFTMDENAALTAEVLGEFIEKHEINKRRYLDLRNQYLGDTPIKKRKEKEKHQPDNRLSSSFAKYLINTFNGFFVGNPLQVNHNEPEIAKVIRIFWNRNSMNDVLSELAKLTSIYGRAYLLVYQDENAATRVAYNDPLDLFMIYSDKIRPSSLYAVRYEPDDDGGYRGQIYERHQWFNFYLEGDTLIKEEHVDELGYPTNQLYYGRVPVIEFIENEERQSLIEPVESLINAYDKVLSEKANDVEYFVDAYLSILGVDIDDEVLKNLKDTRILNIAGDIDTSKLVVEFLEKPDGDQTQENLLNRLEYLIYNNSMVTNLNDKNTTLPASGEALKIRQQPMADLARNKERKFQSALQTLFGMFFSLQTNIDAEHKEEFYNIDYNWSRNEPDNIADEITNAKNLEGIISKRTQLSRLSFISDIDEEMERIDEEF